MTKPSSRAHLACGFLAASLGAAASARADEPPTTRAAQSTGAPPSSAPRTPAPQSIPPPSSAPRLVQMPDEPGDDPSVPGRAMLRWQNQIGETRLHGAWLFSTPAHHGSAAPDSQGVELGYSFGATPALRSFRIGGVYGLLARAADAKTFTASPYYELAGGFRWGIFEINAFSGISWFSVGASHAKFALGLVSPRAGVAVGARLGLGLALHVFAAGEYNLGVLGYDDYRTQMLGVRLTFLTPPASQMPPPPADAPAK